MTKRYELTRSKFLSDDEQEQLTKQLHVDNRIELFITLALRTGARLSELLSLTPNDIDHTNHTIHLIGLKNSKDREMPISIELIRAIGRLVIIQGTKPNERIFNLSRKTIYHYWTQYRPQSNKPFHALRHTFAINLYKKTRDIMLIKTALGHRSIKNTLIYADYVYSTEELRRVL